MVQFSRMQPLPVELGRALALQDFVLSTLDAIQTDRNKRSIVSGTLYHLAYEHASSLLMLVREGHNGSALALFRPAYDALFRGTWVAHAAPEPSIEKLSTGAGCFPSASVMSARIDATAPADLRGIVSAVHRALPHEIRHDLTHGGALQIRQRFDGTTVGPNFHPNTIIPFVRAASCVMAGAALGISLLPGSTVDRFEILGTFLNAFAEGDSDVEAMLNSIEQD